MSFGRRVIGEEEFSRRQRLKEITAGNRFGHRVVGDKLNVPGERLTGEAPFDPDATKTVAGLAAYLKEHPSHINDAIGKEMEEGEPRKGAIAVLLRAERAGEDREEIVTYLENVMKTLGSELPEKEETEEEEEEEGATAEVES